MKLGLIPMGTPILTEITPEKLAHWRAMGVSCIGGRLPDDLDSITADDCRRIASMAADNGLVFAHNWLFEAPLYHPDPDRRARDHDRLRRALALMRALDCPILIIGGGSCSPAGAFSPHALNQTEKAADELIKAARQIVPAAEDAGVYFGVEPLTMTILRGPQRMRRVIDEVGSKYLGVNIDPVNWMTFDTIFYMTDAVNEMFDLLGDSIVSAHAKDGKIEPRVLIHLSECLCGTGLMDWRTFLRRFAQLAPERSLLLEHTPDDDVPAAFGHLRDCAAAEGLAFD